MEFVKIGLVDDHKLFRRGLASLVNSFTDYKVILEVGNGLELLKNLPNRIPDILLLDVNMPGMNGFQTLEILKKDYPGIRVIGLSMDDNENTILKMIGMGARGYILKDSEPNELKGVLDSVWHKGYSYTEFITNSLISSLQNKDFKSDTEASTIALNSREIEFLKWVCQELTYKEIADRMCLSTRTIDGYRDNLFQRLGVKNRVGLALYAVRSGIYEL